MIVFIIIKPFDFFEITIIIQLIYFNVVIKRIQKLLLEDYSKYKVVHGASGSNNNS